MINPTTGNCINLPDPNDASLKVCPEGKYLNILTGRCKKYETADEPKTCGDGYELNPETNRCRKIRANNLSDYPVEEIKTESYDNPQIFVAAWALIALGVAILIYVVIQYRREIAKLFKRAKL